jgi:hypothetical protein
MNALFIPKLGSMVYAMSGMQTKLHLIADEPACSTAAPLPTAAPASPTCISGRLPPRARISMPGSPAPARPATRSTNRPTAR